MNKKERFSRLSTGLLIVALALSLIPPLGSPVQADSAPLVINEIDYDQPSTDTAEFIEIKNVSGGTINLDSYVLELVNGTGGGASVYNTVDLPNVDLEKDGFFVVCGNAANVANCDLDVSPDSNLIQNGSPDAVGLRLDTTLVDAVSYEGDTGAPYTEGSGAGLEDDSSESDKGISRCPDGIDTNENNADFAFTSITPGAANDCALPPPPPEVTIFEIQYTEDPGGDSPYKDKEVITRGVVTAFFYAGGSRYTFIQDGTGPWNGLVLYRPNGFVNVGDLLEVTGEVTEYYGLTEIANGDVIVLGSGNRLPTPEVLAAGDVPQEQWESVLVRVEDVTVTDDDLGYGEWLVGDGSGGVRVDDLSGYDYSPNKGDLLDYVQGPLYYSYSDFKIEPRDDIDIGVPLPLVSICEIQGGGLYSPYAGEMIRAQGVVFADFDRTGIRGFFIQDEACDDDPTTSDGILVYTGNRIDVVNSGDLVEVRGTVNEYYDRTEISTSPWGAAILSDGNPLPVPVALTDLPNESIPAGIAFWEPLEGMRASVQNGFVVAPTSGYGEFAMLTETDADADLGSGYFAQTKQILIRSLGGDMVDYNPERILVDDTSLQDAIVVLPGDRVRSLVGAVDYTFSNYKLQPASYEVKTHNLPKLPASTRFGPKGNTVITTFNVENLFDLVDNPEKEDEGSTPTPEELEVKLAKLALAIRVELELPDIIVVQEVENTGILQELGDRVNDAAGTSYVAESFETSDARGIEVGFLWDENHVNRVDVFQLTDDIVPGVSEAFGPDSPSPGREPLVGVFEIEGREVTIIGNHFKSKSGDDPLFGMDQPPVRITEEQRKAQARVVRDYVNLLLNDANPDALVIVTGDLNDFAFGEPGEGPDHPVAILEGSPGEVPLSNLVNLEKEAETFTYLYDGNSQVLDHMLVSPALLDLFVAVDALHFNASYPSNLGSDATTPLRASDHDPLEGRFDIR